MNLKEGTHPPLSQPKPETLPDQWILIRLNETIQQVNLSLEQFRFDEAANQLYHFIWHEFCDWYLEFSKPLFLEGKADSTRQIMVFTFKEILLLLHPFMPFISEALWEQFSTEQKSLLSLSYPSSRSSEDRQGILPFMENLKEIIKGIRSIRGENNIPPAKELKVYLILKEEDDAHLKELLQKQSAYIIRLCKLSEFKIISNNDSKPAYCATFIGNRVTLYIDLTGVTDPKDEIKRLEKQIEKVNADLALIAKKFENPNFAKNAPEKLVKEEASRKKELEEKRDFLSEEVEKLKKLI